MESGIKVLFADFDGVISRDGGYVGPDSVDPIRLAKLKYVLEETGARLVFSSAWRVVPQVVEQLRADGVPIWVCTPRIDSNHRGDQIAAWLVQHPEVRRFAIVDDDPDAGDGWGLDTRFVQTTTDGKLAGGLEERHVARLIAILNG